MPEHSADFGGKDSVLSFTEKQSKAIKTQAVPDLENQRVQDSLVTKTWLNQKKKSACWEIRLKYLRAEGSQTPCSHHLLSGQSGSLLMGIPSLYEKPKNNYCTFNTQIFILTRHLKSYANPLHNFTIYTYWTSDFYKEPMLFIS